MNIRYSLGQVLECSVKLFLHHRYTYIYQLFICGASNTINMYRLIVGARSSGQHLIWDQPLTSYVTLDK